MEGSRTASAGQLRTEDSWICNRCGWIYPNPHPSAKHRRNHKKICNKTKCSEMRNNPKGGSSGEESSDEHHSAKEAKEGIELRQSEASALTSKPEKCMPILPQSDAILETALSTCISGIEARSSEDTNLLISAVTSNALTETPSAPNSSLSITSDEINDSAMELRKINVNESDLNGTNELELKEKTAFLKEETSTLCIMLAGNLKLQNVNEEYLDSTFQKESLKGESAMAIKGLPQCDTANPTKLSNDTIPPAAEEILFKVGMINEMLANEENFDSLTEYMLDDESPFDKVCGDTVIDAFKSVKGHPSQIVAAIDDDDKEEITEPIDLFEIVGIQNGDPKKHAIMENTTMQNSDDSPQNMNMKQNLDVDDELDAPKFALTAAISEDPSKQNLQWSSDLFGNNGYSNIVNVLQEGICLIPNEISLQGFMYTSVIEQECDTREASCRKTEKTFDLMQKATATIGRSDSMDQKINEHGCVTVPSELLKQIAKQPETQYLEASSLPSHLDVINTDSSNQSLQEHLDVLITKKFIKPEESLEVVTSTLTPVKDTHFGDIIVKENDTKDIVDIEAKLDSAKILEYLKVPSPLPDLNTNSLNQSLLQHSGVITTERANESKENLGEASTQTVKNNGKDIHSSAMVVKGDLQDAVYIEEELNSKKILEGSNQPSPLPDRSTLNQLVQTVSEFLIVERDVKSEGNLQEVGSTLIVESEVKDTHASDMIFKDSDIQVLANIEEKLNLVKLHESSKLLKPLTDISRNSLNGNLQQNSGVISSQRVAESNGDLEVGLPLIEDGKDCYPNAMVVQDAVDIQEKLNSLKMPKGLKQQSPLNEEVGSTLNAESNGKDAHFKAMLVKECAIQGVVHIGEKLNLIKMSESSKQPSPLIDMSTSSLYQRLQQHSDVLISERVIESEGNLQGEESKLNVESTVKDTHSSDIAGKDSDRRDTLDIMEKPNLVKILESSKLASSLTDISTDSSSQTSQKHSDVVYTGRVIESEGDLEAVGSGLKVETNGKDSHSSAIVAKECDRQGAVDIEEKLNLAKLLKRSEQPILSTDMSIDSFNQSLQQHSVILITESDIENDENLGIGSTLMLEHTAKGIHFSDVFVKESNIKNAADLEGKPNSAEMLETSELPSYLVNMTMCSLDQSIQDPSDVHIIKRVNGEVGSTLIVRSDVHYVLDIEEKRNLVKPLERSKLASHLTKMSTDSLNQSLPQHSDVIVTEIVTESKGTLEVGSTLIMEGNGKHAYSNPMIVKECDMLSAADIEEKLNSVKMDSTSSTVTSSAIEKSLKISKDTKIDNIPSKFGAVISTPVFEVTEITNLEKSYEHKVMPKEDAIEEHENIVTPNGDRGAEPVKNIARKIDPYSSDINHLNVSPTNGNETRVSRTLLTEQKQGSKAASTRRSYNIETEAHEDAPDMLETCAGVVPIQEFQSLGDMPTRFAQGKAMSADNSPDKPIYPTERSSSLRVTRQVFDTDDLKAPSPEAWQELSASETGSDRKNGNLRLEELNQSSEAQKDYKSGKSRTALRNLMAKEGPDNTSKPFVSLKGSRDSRKNIDPKIKPKSFWAHCICCSTVH